MEVAYKRNVREVLGPVKHCGRKLKPNDLIVDFDKMLTLKRRQSENNGSYRRQNIGVV